jgi:dienelactone hydrolase
MNRLLLAIALVGPLGCGGPDNLAADTAGDNETGGETDSGAAPCGELEPRNETEVSYCNPLGEAIIALWQPPAKPAPAGGFPVVLVLHGSGGLFDETDTPGVCLEEPEQQFERWGERLNAAGYAMLAPASFYSRGFCEYRDDQPIPPGYDERERLISRTFDVRGAVAWLCARDDVDCSKIALLGFSNGGSTTLLSVYESLGTPAQSSGSDADPDPRLLELAGPTPVVGAVAYYPGCDLHDQVDDSLATADLPAFYFPAVPTLVHHAELDELREDCEQIRLPQTEAVSADRGLSENPFALSIFVNADHGFDNADEGEDLQADLDARDAAADATMAALAAWFGT